LVTKRSEVRSEGRGDRVAHKGLDNIGKVLTISISFLHNHNGAFYANYYNVAV
jgi:hypothetical protein